MANYKLGVTNGKLAACPSSPNCILSQIVDKTDSHYIAPIELLSDNYKYEMQQLVKIVESQPRAKIIQSNNYYLYATFTSLIFRYVDDVEFCLDAEAQVFHVRSASRVGHSDFGVNRQRVEKIRSIYNADK